MATSTKEITKKLHKQAIEKMKPLIEQLVSEGADPGTIISAAKSVTRGKVEDYYAWLKRPTQIRTSLRLALEQIPEADSKAEVIFYDLLHEHFTFKFQYKIGMFRVDYLIGDDLVVELDGPQHDKPKDAIRDEYLAKLGYRVLRIPIYVLAMGQNAVIAGIKEALETT